MVATTEIAVSLLWLVVVALASYSNHQGIDRREQVGNQNQGGSQGRHCQINVLREVGCNQNNLGEDVGNPQSICGSIMLVELAEERGHRTV